MITGQWLVASLFVFGCFVPTWADDGEDGPGRGVARISVLNGDVSVRRGDSGDYVAAAINAPVIVQDSVLTGTASRAELQFDWANMLRVSSKAEVRLAELEYRRYLVQVARGTVTWRVLRDQEAYVEISTPSISVRPVKKGIYRVSVAEDGSSEVTVRSGEAEIFTPRGSERLKSGKTMLARGTTADPEFQIVAEIPADEWDRWNEYRDRDLDRARSYTYVSRDIYGAEDLDAHGRWVNIPPYGWVWSPYAAPGWAPYRYGRWAWIDWYGWSWVSYDPWGWAPYHYGRWFHNGPYGWCWWPGSIRARHYWSPGFVAFFGFGSVRVGLGWGNVGWVPLAPYEPYHRWWGPRWYGGYRGGTYIDNSVTVVNNVNVTNVYRNARIREAVTVIDRDGFTAGRSGSIVGLNGADLSRAVVARGPLPVTPRNESLRFTEHEARVRDVAGTRSTERFFSHRAPAQVQRVSFEEQRNGIERISRRSSAGEPARVTAEQRTERPAGVAESTPERTQEGERGWRRVGERPATLRPEAGRESVAPRASDGEWRRFGAARVTESQEPAGSGGRFGEPAATRTQERSTVSPRGDGGREENGWVRFGEQTVRPEAEGRSERAPRSAETRNESPARQEAAPRNEAPARVESVPRSERRPFDSPRVNRSEPRGDSGESIRISPPIVRERSGGSFGGGGGRNAEVAPRSAPAHESAPRSGGGGGRVEGGGGRGGGMRGR